MVEFFDLISFFGVAAFFAWLGYAPLRAQLLKEVETQKQKQAKQTLDKITDYFFVSFLSFSVAAVSVYVEHHRLFITLAYDQRWILLFLMGSSSILGFFTLFVPIVYLRAKDLGDINPPPFMVTFGVVCVIATQTVLWIVDLYISRTILGMALSLLSGLILYVCAIQVMRHWYTKDWKSFLYFPLMLSPFAVLVLLTFFRAPPL
ncbi:MAG: hypothetical protein WCC94_05495 [Candidatus Bathyarchaeia archaeon]